MDIEYTNVQTAFIWCWCIWIQFYMIRNTINTITTSNIICTKVVTCCSSGSDTRGSQDRQNLLKGHVYYRRSALLLVSTQHDFNSKLGTGSIHGFCVLSSWNMDNEIGNIFRGNLKIPLIPPPQKGCVKKSKQLKRCRRKIDISDNLRNSNTATRLKELQSCALNIGSILQRKEMWKSRPEVPFDKSSPQLTG